VEPGSGIPLHFFFPSHHQFLEYPMANDFPRGKPLQNCPHASCGRGNRTCLKLAAGEKCLKTHYATHFDWVLAMAACMDDFTRLRALVKNPSEEETECFTMICNAFEWRIEESFAEEAAAKYRDVR
jgi:hypothetical protein